MQTRNIVCNGWTFKFADLPIQFGLEHQERASQVLSQWGTFFPKENTWVQNTHKVPSLIVRLDCVIHEGELFLYEIEERPSGIGLTCLLNEQFKNRLAELRAKWPTFKVVISSRRQKGTDDHLWLGVDNSDNSSLVLVRAEPDESDFHYLEVLSVSSVKEKGNKGYGVLLGLWEEILTEDEVSLPWDSTFVLKPVQGSKCHNIRIWSPIDKSKGIGGLSTRTKICQTLAQEKRMFLQSFVPPMNIENSEYKAILRLFFGFDPELRSYSYLGGLWVARPNQFIVHGATDNIVGPVCD